MWFDEVQRLEKGALTSYYWHTDINVRTIKYSVGQRFCFFVRNWNRFEPVRTTKLNETTHVYVSIIKNNHNKVFVSKRISDG